MFKKQQGIQYIDLKSKSGQQRKFIKVKYLGSGGFARCYEIYEQLNNTKQHFAFKIIKKSMLQETNQLIDRLRTQIKLHKKFSQPHQTNNQHIVRFIESFQTQDYIYLLLELCVNQTLNELIRRRKFLTEEETRFYVSQLAKGLKDLHSKNVVHRDIKLCNLFLAQGLKIKIGDFGLATEIQQQRKRYTICGTANYIAPEMIKQDSNGGPIGHGYEVDVWALGVVCYTIFYGRYPFQAHQEQSIYNKVLSCKYSFNPYSMKQIKELNINGLNHFPSDDLKSFIKGIFELDPSKRFTLDQVLNHSFLNKTTIPKELPQISLKCALKKDTIEKLFTKKQNAQFSEKISKDEVSENNQYQKNQENITKSHLNSTQTKNYLSLQISSNQKKLEERTIKHSEEMCFQKKYSIQTREQNLQKPSETPVQNISRDIFSTSLHKNEETQTNNSIFLRFERKRKSSNQIASNDDFKIITENFLLEIVLSHYSLETFSLEKCMLDGMMIKVYNFMPNFCEKVDSSEISYTIIIHPKLNYLTKVIEPLKTKYNPRMPLGQATQEPKNQQTTNSQQKDVKQRVVVKIPLTKNGQSLKFDKGQNKPNKRYIDQLNIVKKVYGYLSKLGSQRHYRDEHIQRTDEVTVN